MKLSIINALNKYINENNIRFHMPGHKGHCNDYDILKQISENLYSLDLTEVDGTDDLHSPESSIKESQEDIAKIYNAKESFYIVNGSTAGIYSMILSCTNKGDKIIIQRNCHRSVFMAAYLGSLETEYITPSVLDDFSFAASISPKDVENSLKENPDAKAVVLTSPTYYGTCINIKEISKITNKYGVLLLIDAAHGAHFPFNKNLPNNPIVEGADMEVVSFHKTLPSLTQTGVLNVSKNAIDKIDIGKLKFMLSLYQSTSPSYIFLSSMEAAAYIMKKDGDVLLNNVIEYINDFKNKIKKHDFYKVLGKEHIGQSNINNLDDTRLVISSKIGGAKLSQILRENYQIQVEMADDKNIIIIGSVFDKKYYYEKLYNALVEIESKYKDLKWNNKKYEILDYTYKKIYTIEKGYSLEKETILLKDSIGKVAGEIVAPYPPGIPILLPGEEITYNKIKCIENCKNLGIRFNGPEDKSLNTIKIIK